PTSTPVSALAAAFGVAPVGTEQGLEPGGGEPGDGDPDEFDEADDEDDTVAAVPNVEHGTAAKWLEIVPADGTTPRPWRLDLVRAYADWTYIKNGAGLSRHATLNGNFRAWNEAFFYQLGL